MADWVSTRAASAFAVLEDGDDVVLVVNSSVALELDELSAVDAAEFGIGRKHRAA